MGTICMKLAWRSGILAYHDLHSCRNVDYRIYLAYFFVVEWYFDISVYIAKHSNIYSKCYFAFLLFKGLSVSSKAWVVSVSEWTGEELMLIITGYSLSLYLIVSVHGSKLPDPGICIKAISGDCFHQIYPVIIRLVPPKHSWLLKYYFKKDL